MISKLMMVSGSVCLLASMLVRRQEEAYKRLFNSLRKCPKFHMDYVDDVKHLPLDKPLILHGLPHQEKQFSNAIYLPEKVSSQMIKIKMGENFQLLTSQNQPVEIVPGAAPIWVFQLPKTGNTQNSNPQRAVLKGQSIWVYGKISNQDNKFQLHPELMMGASHESLLTYIDQKIITISGRNKVCLIVGTSLLVAHLIIYKIQKEPNPVLLDMEQQK